MTKQVVVSVPGKLILMGEHAAVYGRPALVTAVAPRATVTLSSRETDVFIDLPDLDERSTWKWSDIVADANRARQDWQRYAEEPTPERFRVLQTGSPARLVATALGEVAHDLRVADLPPLGLKVTSELPIGSGFGSSAATAVAVVGALLAFVGQDADRRRIDRIVFEVERRLHGLPSGVDHKTVLLGGVVWAEPDRGSGFEVSPLDVRSELLTDLQVFQTGRPRETTGEVVAAVRHLKKQQPNRFESTLEEMSRTVRRFRDQLCGIAEPEPTAAAEIRTYERCLEEIGVVPESIRRSIRAVEKDGGVAKISGAGALTGDAAGCLLVHLPGADSESLPDELNSYQPQEVELGAEGFRVEEIA